jgi:hypothetical protein
MGQGNDRGKDSDVKNNDGIVNIHPTKDNLTYDMGIYCDCNDYTIHPEKYKKTSANAFNIVGALVAFLAIFLIVRKEES